MSQVVATVAIFVFELFHVMNVGVDSQGDAQLA